MEVRGADAPLSDSDWTYRFLRARANSIEGGTTEILKNIVAERVLGLPEAAMNFDFTDDQQPIKSTAQRLPGRALQAREGARAGRGRRVRRRPLGGDGELGWTGIFIDEDYGGQGLGDGRARDPAGGARLRARALAVLLERRRRAAAPARRQRRAEAAVAAGDRVGRGARHGRASDGSAPLVPDAEAAAVVVLVDGDGAEASAADVEPVDTIDSTRRSRPCPPTAARRSRATPRRPSTGYASRWPPSSWASRSGRWRWRSSTRATASSSAGRSAPTRRSRTAVRRCCWRSRAPARPRSTPPGRPTTSRTTLPLAASMAKAYASDAGTRVTASALQVHGGIGFTWEHDLHFFLKRANVDAHLFGDAREHRDRVAQLAGLRRALRLARRVREVALAGVTRMVCLRRKSRTATLPRLTVVSVPSQRSVTVQTVPRTVAAEWRPRVRKRPLAFAAQAADRAPRGAASRPLRGSP